MPHEVLKVSRQYRPSLLSYRENTGKGRDRPPTSQERTNPIVGGGGGVQKPPQVFSCVIAKRLEIGS